MNNNRITIGLSNIVTAFDEKTIGTKVSSFEPFMELLIGVIKYHNFDNERIPGQAVINIPGACHFISGGMGHNRDNPNDYVLRSHRGKVHSYLKREFAEPVTDCHVVVYTRDAYLNDPDIDEEPNEAERIRQSCYTHILVAILASSGAPSTLSPYRFVKNLAGGNHEALAWTADEIREKAREIANNIDNWCVVAD